MRRGVEHSTAFLVTVWTYAGRPVFADRKMAALFCRTLVGLRQRLGFKVQAYVVLPDRVRLIIAANDEDPRWVQVVVQRLKSRFAREMNQRSGRLGLVWQDADQRVLLGDPAQVAKRAELLHQHPVLSRLARHPGEWRFSSFRAWRGEMHGPVPIDLPERSWTVSTPGGPGARPI
jgi:putative transposase